MSPDIAPLRKDRAFDVARDLLGASTGGWCLVVDADRTLSAEDASRSLAIALGINDRICAAFRRLGYVDDAFGAVSRIFGEVRANVYQAAAAEVARSVQLRRQWTEVFGRIGGHVPVVVMTAGSPAVWRHILAIHDLATIPVVGGCHPELDPHFVSAASKADVAQALLGCGVHVVAAGDSLVDAPMLRVASRALIVPDTKGSPALCEAMRDAAHVGHFDVGPPPSRPFPLVSPDQLSRLLLSKGNDHAVRSHTRTALEALRRPNAPQKLFGQRTLQRPS